MVDARTCEFWKSCGDAEIRGENALGIFILGSVIWGKYRGERICFTKAWLGGFEIFGSFLS